MSDPNKFRVDIESAGSGRVVVRGLEADLSWTVNDLRTKIAEQAKLGFVPAQARLFKDYKCTEELKADANDTKLADVDWMVDAKTIVLVITPKWKDCATGDMPHMLGTYGKPQAGPKEVF